MARVARVMIAGLPYHVTHRGNRGEPVFYSDEDRSVYMAWLSKYAGVYGMRVWAYCLMTNHVHLVAVGDRQDSLSKAIGRTQMRYARWLNAQRGWTGHLWGNRYFSTPLDEAHLWAAAKYVELNPVRACLVQQAEEYDWSSARTHVKGLNSALLAADRPFPGDAMDWSGWLAEGIDDAMTETLRRNTYTGRPTGSKDFVSWLEKALNRNLRPQKRGRKPGNK